jgi:hypothetical protein
VIADLRRTRRKVRRPHESAPVTHARVRKPWVNSNSVPPSWVRVVRHLPKPSRITRIR